MAKVYECHNSSCSLGTTGNPGQFTGGIAAEQLNLLTGQPVEAMVKGEHYGEGFCPNCGKQGEERTAASVQKEALAAAKAAYEAEVAAIKAGGA